MSLLGIDVSSFQPNTNWAQVKANGVSFAFIKATDGLHYQNPSFLHDFQAAEAQGIVAGAYHFFRAGSDPGLQVKHFLRVYKHKPGDLRPMFDWELADGMSVKDQKERARLALDLLKMELGSDPFLYSYEAYLHALGDMSDFSSNPLYIAKYSSHMPILPAAWRYWTIWQKSGAGHIGGVETPVDLDAFNGTEDTLSKFRLA